MQEQQTTSDIDAEKKAETPRDATAWLELIKDGEKAFATYNDKCDKIDKLYADLSGLTKGTTDRQFQIFWANLEVLKPSMYSRPPVPVVVPRFKDQKELPRKVAELLERTLVTSFDVGDIDDTMKLARDDLAVNSRGVAWVRYEAEEADEGLAERVCFDHLDRKDFLHEPARKWAEVGWVARRSYLSLTEGKKRFGEDFTSCTFEEIGKRDDNKENDYEGEKKAQVWEIWSKVKNVVVWVSPGVKDVLDVQPPFLTLEGFFPCPRPAYGTVQRNSLIPVPDFVYYRDQIEEINELTDRISALSESLRLKGFYAQGSEDITSSIERAMKSTDNNAILIPVPTFAMAQGASIKDAILWLPVVEVATVIKELIALRKQIIEDVYQITGISDIMRGSTSASETLGAQQLKSQYGSIRIRDRQGELVRLAKDLTKMAAEIVSENFQPQTMLDMSQMELPTRAMVEQKQAQMAMQAQATGQPAPPPPPIPITLDDVFELLHKDRTRPFILDIETDSTIQPDEDAEKQRRTEFITAVGGFMQQAMPLVQAAPQAAEMATEMLKFVASGFRAGRELQGSIDRFAEEMKKVANQPKPPNPEVEAQKAEMQIAQMKAQADMQMAQLNLQAKNADVQIKQLELQGKMAEASAPQMVEQPKPLEAEKTQAEIGKIIAETAKIEGETKHAAVNTITNAMSAAHAMDMAEQPPEPKDPAQ